jgi:putative nucleotidyltransferase with HDIG domain
MGMSLHAAGLPRPGALRTGRYLPMSVAVTVAVVALPLLAVAQLGAARTPLAIALHVLAAVVLSMLIAQLLAAIWTRSGRSIDVVFGDLLIWGWIRRTVAEQRLEAVSRELSKPSGGDAYGELLRRMSSLLEARDPYTHGHSRRVARHAERIARELGLAPEQVAKVRAAALVHDIGKINVPRPILNKPGQLTDAEFALVKRHPGDGAAMVAALGDAELTAIVRSHHERIDGTGYPDGLAGADIPIGARIIAVADTFDAITSARPYRRSRTHKQALDVMRAEGGMQLDAAAVAAFASYYSARRSVGWVSVIVTAPQRLLTGLGGASTGLSASVAPLAQTACGVGGVALVGACLGGAVPSGSVDRHAALRSGSEPRQVIADAGSSGAAPVTPRHHAPPHKARVRERGVAATPDERVGSQPGLRAPAGSSPSGGQTSSGSGTTVNPSEAVPDDVVETPDQVPVALPKVEDVIESVTDQLPPVQAPVQPPQVQLPQLQVGLPSRKRPARPAARGCPTS